MSVAKNNENNSSETGPNGEKIDVRKVVCFNMFRCNTKKFIVRFGRFPHWNAILGRTATDPDIQFLKGSGSSF